MKMKPCPFCDNENYSRSISHTTDIDGSPMYFVQCEHCNMCGPECDNKEGAVELWNECGPRGYSENGVCPFCHDGIPERDKVCCQCLEELIGTHKKICVCID